MLITGCSGAVPSVNSDSSAAPSATPPLVRIGPDGPEPPDVEGLVAYGTQHSDAFGGLYLDPPGGGTVVMLFTHDLDTHQRAVNEIRPGTRVRQVEFTEAALLALLESLDFEALAADGMEMVSAGLDTIGNRVTLDLKSNDPTAELRLELAHGGMLEVTVFPLAGEWANVQSGDGWRLLVARDGLGADAFTVRAATTVAEWSQLAQALGIEPAQPHPDLETEVVVAFFHGVGSSCPEMRLDAVEIGAGVVFSRVSDPLAPRACTADLAASAVFIVAVERSALPADGFTLRLTEDGVGEPIEVSLP